MAVAVSGARRSSSLIAVEVWETAFNSSTLPQQDERGDHRGRFEIAGNDAAVGVSHLRREQIGNQHRRKTQQIRSPGADGDERELFGLTFFTEATHVQERPSAPEHYRR